MCCGRPCQDPSERTQDRLIIRTVVQTLAFALLFFGTTDRDAVESLCKAQWFRSLPAIIFARVSTPASPFTRQEVSTAPSRKIVERRTTVTDAFLSCPWCSFSSLVWNLTSLEALQRCAMRSLFWRLNDRQRPKQSISQPRCTFG